MHDQHQQEINQRERSLRIQRLITDSGAPQRHWRTTPLRSGQWGGKLAELEKLTPGSVIALIGGNARGKTQMAVELMRAHLIQNKSARFITAVGLFQEFRASFRRDSALTEKDVTNEFVRPALLVIDEIGKRAETPWEEILLFEVINRRFNDLKTTVVIDNRPLVEFQKRLEPSLVSRIITSGGVVDCNWPQFNCGTAQTAGSPGQDAPDSHR